MCRIYNIEVFAQKGQLDSVYTDFSKAFDSVNHDLLVKKLLLLGCNMNTVKLIESYLKNSSLYVIIVIQNLMCFEFCRV